MVSVYPARWCTPLSGSCPLGWVTGVGPLSRRRQTSKGVSFYFPCISFFWEHFVLFFQEYNCGFFFTAGYASS